MSRFSKGFTLIEVLVSIGIMGVLMSVIFSNQNIYTDTASISDLADEISISLSQAQAYGIAVRELTPGSSDFSASYGMSFSLLSDGSNSSYLFFADKNGNSVYDGDWSCATGSGSECLEKTNITRGNYIDSFCVIKQNQNDDCTSPQRVDISFVRPNTESQIKIFNNGGQNMSVPQMLGVKIILKNPRGLTKTVSVYNSGQISVQ